MSTIRDTFLENDIPVWAGLQNGFTQRVLGVGVNRDTECEDAQIRANQWAPSASDRLSHTQSHRAFMTHARPSNQLSEAKKAMALQRGPP